jgi:hypothetical protein
VRSSWQKSLFVVIQCFSLVTCLALIHHIRSLWFKVWLIFTHFPHLFLQPELVRSNWSSSPALFALIIFEIGSCIFCLGWPWI